MRSYALKRLTLNWLLFRTFSVGLPSRNTGVGGESCEYGNGPCWRCTATGHRQLPVVSLEATTTGNAACGPAPPHRGSSAQCAAAQRPGANPRQQSARRALGKFGRMEAHPSPGPGVDRRPVGLRSRCSTQIVVVSIPCCLLNNEVEHEVERRDMYSTCTTHY